MLYQWFILVTLKALFILPVVWVAAGLTRRTSSSVICLVLLVTLLVTLCSPWLSDLYPILHLQISGLELTEAFPREIDTFSQFEQSHPFPDNPDETSKKISSPYSIERILCLVWLLGTICFLTYKFWHSLNTKLAYTNSNPLPDSHPTAVLLAKIIEQSPKSRKPWLLTNPHIDGPHTSGIIKPLILLPLNFEKLPEAQQSMILRHELAHIQRHDVFVGLLLELVATIFWFHPLFHLLIKRFHLEAERSCDDAVIHQGALPSDYCETILASATSNASQGDAPVIKKRIKSLLQHKKNRLPLSSKSILSFTLLTTLSILPLCLISISPYTESKPFTPLLPNSELKALWKMNLNRGTIIPDWSGHGRHGKVIGAHWVYDLERGHCLSFDGKDDYLALTAPDADWTRKPFSLSVWLKPAKNSNGGGLLLKGDYNGIWSSALGDSDQPENELISFGEREICLIGEMRQPFNQYVHTPQPGQYPALNYYNLAFHHSDQQILTDSWTHLTITYEPSPNSKPLTRMYLNGELTFTHQYFDNAIGKTIDWPAKFWYFARGESPVSKDNHYEGLASNLAIYQKVLSQDEVKKIMHGRF